MSAPRSPETPNDASTGQPNAANEFAEQANAPSSGLIAEFWDFLRNNKKWWLAPIIIILLLLGLFVLLSSTAVAPFIYPLF